MVILERPSKGSPGTSETSSVYSCQMSCCSNGNLNTPRTILFFWSGRWSEQVWQGGKILVQISIQERLSSQRGVTLILVDSSANNKEAGCAKRSPVIGALELSRSDPIYRLPALFPRICLRTRASRQMCMVAL